MDLEHVYLKDLTDFEWERVCVVLPYMSNEDIKQKQGLNIMTLPIMMDNGGCYLLISTKN